MTKHELSERSGVSISFLSDLTTGKANPSLKIMEQISSSLDVPLPLLLESTDMDPSTLDALSGSKLLPSLPPGYERVSAVLPSYQAFRVRRWAEQSHDDLQKKMYARVGQGGDFSG